MVRWVARHPGPGRSILLIMAGLGVLDATWSAIAHDIAWWHALLRAAGGFLVAWVLGWYGPRLANQHEQEQASRDS